MQTECKVNVNRFRIESDHFVLIRTDSYWLLRTDCFSSSGPRLNYTAGVYRWFRKFMKIMLWMWTYESYVMNVLWWNLCHWCYAMKLIRWMFAMNILRWVFFDEYFATNLLDDESYAMNLFYLWISFVHFHLCISFMHFTHREQHRLAN